MPHAHVEGHDRILATRKGDKDAIGYGRRSLDGTKKREPVHTLATSSAKGTATGNGTHPGSRPLRKENAGRTHSAGLVANRRSAARDTTTSARSRVDRTADATFITRRHRSPPFIRLFHIALAKKSIFMQCYICLPVFFFRHFAFFLRQVFRQPGHQPSPGIRFPHFRRPPGSRSCPDRGMMWGNTKFFPSAPSLFKNRYP